MPEGPRTAGAVRKDNQGIASGGLWIEHPQVQIFISPGIVQHDVVDFDHLVRSGLQLVAVIIYGIVYRRSGIVAIHAGGTAGRMRQ